MSNYLNFTNYNQAAESIRPTARIQLIQRILNAASIISSLASGVPLKWAGSYKSFQVLKYAENQDPTDVTTAEAVSAVNSILYENRAQINSSSDDMETLASEIQAIPLRGKISYKQMVADLVPSDADMQQFCLLLTPAGIQVGLAMSKTGACTGMWYGPSSAYTSLPANQKYITRSNLPICITENPSTGVYSVTALVADNQDRIRMWRMDVNVNSAVAFKQIYYSGDASLSSHATLTWADFTSANDITYVAFVLDSTSTMTGVAGSNAEVLGNADVHEYLGLPDASGVISAIDDLLS